MSTLAMLRAEGRAKGKIVINLKTLLKAIINFPTFSPKQISLLVDYKEELITQFLITLKTKESKGINNFIEKHFLKTIKLNKEEKKEINQLLKKIKERKGKN